MQAIRPPSTTGHLSHRTPPLFLLFSLRLIAIIAFALVVEGAARQSASAAEPPELPRVFLDTTFPPLSGATLPVPAGGDLQAALNIARPGDTIVLDAGATYAGSFTLPAKEGDGWIVLRSNAPDGQLPPEGTRIAPSVDAPWMPKIVTTTSEPALRTAAGARQWRLVGLEIAVAAAVPFSYGIVVLGTSDQNVLAQVPVDLVID